MRPFYGLVVRRLLLLWLTWCVHHGWLCALWWCLFLQGVFQHLVYLLVLASQSLSNVDSIEGYNLEGSVDLFCLSELLMIHRPNSLGVSLLSTWLADLLGSSFPYVTCLSQGISEILGRTALRLKRCPRKSCPCLRIFLVAKKVSWDGFFTLTTGLLRWPSLLVLWGKRD